MNNTYQALNFQVSPQLAELEVNYKYKCKPGKLPIICTSQDTEKVLRSVWSDKIEFVEEFVLLLLNRRNRMLGYVKLSQGGTHGTVTDIKLIFAIALKFNASAIILSHNHPSQNTEPSITDLKVTREIKEAGKLFEISVLDHIILCSENYYSFADNGTL